MRNKGFAFTAGQKLARWDDLGGPGRFEKWALQSPRHYMASRMASAPAGAVGALVTVWLLGWDAGRALAMAGGFLLGAVVIVIVAGKGMWSREQDVYDTWLIRRRRPKAPVP